MILGIFFKFKEDIISIKFGKFLLLIIIFGWIFFRDCFNFKKENFNWILFKWYNFIFEFKRDNNFFFFLYKIK